MYLRSSLFKNKQAKNPYIVNLTKKKKNIHDSKKHLECIT